DTRHHHVGDHDMEPAIGQLVERFLPVGGGFHCVAPQRDHGGQGGALALFVVYHQNPGLRPFRCHPALYCASRRLAHVMIHPMKVRQSLKGVKIAYALVAILAAAIAAYWLGASDPPEVPMWAPLL